MGKNMPNIDLATVIVDGGNQSVFVAPDIENRHAIHIIGTDEGSAQVIEVRVNCCLHQRVPSLQSPLGIGVFHPERDDERLRDHMHSNQSIPLWDIVKRENFCCLADGIR